MTNATEITISSDLNWYLSGNNNHTCSFSWKYENKPVQEKYFRFTIFDGKENPMQKAVLATFNENKIYQAGFVDVDDAKNWCVKFLRDRKIIVHESHAEPLKKSGNKVKITADQATGFVVAEYIDANTHVVCGEKTLCGENIERKLRRGKLSTKLRHPFKVCSNCLKKIPNGDIVKIEKSINNV